MYNRLYPTGTIRTWSLRRDKVSEQTELNVLFSFVNEISSAHQRTTLSPARRFQAAARQAPLGPNTKILQAVDITTPTVRIIIGGLVFYVVV